MNLQMQEVQWIPASRVPKVRSIGQCIVFFIITFGIYSLFWIYNTHEEHPRRSGIDQSGGKVIVVTLILAGLGFIIGSAMGEGSQGGALVSRLFAYASSVWLVFAYVKLTDRLNMLATSMSSYVPQANPIFAWLGLIPGIGFIFNIIWWFQIMEVHNAIASNVSHAPMGQAAPPQGGGYPGMDR